MQWEDCSAVVAATRKLLLASHSVSLAWDVRTPLTSAVSHRAQSAVVLDLELGNKLEDVGHEVRIHLAVEMVCLES
jgi:hypothetical protein